MIAGKRCDVKKALSKEEMLKAQQQERDRAGRGERSSRGYGESGGRSDRGSSYGGYSDRGGGGRNSDYGSSSGMGGASAWSQGIYYHISYTFAPVKIDSHVQAAVPVSLGVNSNNPLGVKWAQLVDMGNNRVF